MLILQRKKGQEVYIGDNVKVSIAEIGSDWVKLAIDAPKELSILRKELVETAKANREAIQDSSSSALKQLSALMNAKN